MINLIVPGIVALVQWISETKDEDSKPDPAIEILRRYCARGEIRKEEFAERCQKLQQ